ncbi:MAG: hypothetical protein ACLP7O_12515 [Terracidiphilus sp.]
MNGLIGGLFGITYQLLNLLGKGVTWVLFGKRAVNGKFSYAWIGGTVLFGAFGAFAGSLLACLSTRFNAAVGAILGGLLGLSLGAPFGWFVQYTDELIEYLLGSKNSK